MKVILTGGAGFIGSAFLSHLNSRGIEDIIVVDIPSDISTILNLKNKKFKNYLTRENFLSSIEKDQHRDVDVLVHLGACADTTEKDREFLKKNNLEYSQTLARWALRHGKQFHYASSASVYGDGSMGYSDDDASLEKFHPLNPYAESKFLFDQWLIKEKLTDKVVGYRYFNVFGPNEYHKGEMQSLVSKAYRQLNTIGKVRLFAASRPGDTDGCERRDFVYVKDINQIMMYFIENPDKKGIFNLGTGLARSFKDLALAVFKALGKEPVLEFFPMPEKLKGQYQYFTQADISKLRAAGYKTPFLSLEDSVKDYVLNHLSQENPMY